MTSSLSPIHLAIALDGTGWHPGSWRQPHSRAAEVFSGAYWTDLAREAEHGLVDFVTIEDSFTVQGASPLDPTPVPGGGRLRGRLDASLLASFVATRTEHIGLVPTITTTHTEPFHVSKNLATLDHVSNGRGGWRVQVSGRPGEAEHFGRRRIPGFFDPEASSEEKSARVNELFDEAADVVEVVRQLWDSWEDGAEIRDSATGRFIDRDKLHYIDFEGDFFSVRGPSITPRPPQGQPVVTALGHATIPYELAARGADVLFVTPHDDDSAARILGEVRDAEARVRADETPLLVFADLEVVLDTPEASGAQRLTALDEAAGQEFASDALIVTGSVTELAALIGRWQALGYGGFRLRPAEHAVDLPLITGSLVPLLQEAGAFRTAYDQTTLRDRLGLPLAANRHATAS
ncbi:LLM class flavin-dependent oxidoreductase [Ornithinimicrobium cavernae]|uniref:LLM class flavin-dependent oxidoreductase n=1 Tax=Ornithinimicrobium cavernae TaxID=2666047 RepID=UPI000D69F0E0|nr:LLM class flavin-dependent oxidoreductase [Ornithinimicrobium cavernae]